MTEQVFIGVHRGKPIAAGLVFDDPCQALDIALTSFGGVVHDPWSPTRWPDTRTDDVPSWIRYYRTPLGKEGLEAQLIYRFPLMGIETFSDRVRLQAHREAVDNERLRIDRLCAPHLIDKSVKGRFNRAAWKQVLGYIHRSAE